MGDLTISGLFRLACSHHREATAVRFADEEWSYRRLGEHAARIGHALRAWGLEAGDRAAILSPNAPEYLAAYYGIMLGGLVTTPVGVRLPSGGHAHIIGDCGARALFFHGDLLGLVEEMRPSIPSVERFVCIRATGRSMPDWVTPYEEVTGQGSTTPPDVVVGGDDLAAIQYTGGTTGKPRGACWPHRSMALGWELFLLEFEFNADDTLMVAGPLSHGSIQPVLPTLVRGGRILILDAFDPDVCLQLVEEQRVTTTMMVPTMIYALLDRPQVRSRDLSSLKNVFYGGAPMALERLEEACASLGQIWIQLYAQSECLGITFLAAEDHRTDSAEARARLASCGRACVATEIRLADQHGKEVSAGDIGEITVRSPYQMHEYWKRPEDTAATIRDGWLHTGDLARVDDGGYYFIVDRVKDMIISGGFNVYSKEVEDALSEHPDVAQTAVIGVPDPKWGEAVTACVVLRDGGTVAAEDLIAFVRARKGPVQTPKTVHLLDALPLTQAMKPDKKALRARFGPRGERRDSVTESGTE